jgi:hypothetical protein
MPQVWSAAADQTRETAILLPDDRREESPLAAKTPLFATKSTQRSRKKPGKLPGFFLRQTSLSVYSFS